MQLKIVAKTYKDETTRTVLVVSQPSAAHEAAAADFGKLSKP